MKYNSKKFWREAEDEVAKKKSWSVTSREIARIIGVDTISYSELKASFEPGIGRSYFVYSGRPDEKGAFTLHFVQRPVGA
ncbi:hypothetical protein HNR46_002337 [Haloferula luteola]|uniref:Uncharacterized protein n=1 Tax=Haloferula luteola TaxID=595692 RepID=A0A840V4X7_9BACT|nr:hypothetical protein [Haloferula luteola]MBB5352096.1 hypothetical protein [Haloferula luteola]